MNNMNRIQWAILWSFLERNISSQYYRAFHVCSVDNTLPVPRCENFQAENRNYYDEFVFLGTEEEFLKKYAWNFILLAQYDRYEYD